MLNLETAASTPVGKGMVAIQTVVSASGANGNELPVDFYAVIAAVCGAVLFAKFATHKASPTELWPILHFFCVMLALAGLGGSVLALGWGLASMEDGLRIGVAICAAGASILLIIDFLASD
jgi:hypothetical protein